MTTEEEILKILANLPEDKFIKVVEMIPEGERESLILMSEEYRKALTRERGQKDFLEFVKTMWPIFISGKHHARGDLRG